jgi:hypothetical protein
MRSIDLDFDGGYDEFIYEIRARLKLIWKSMMSDTLLQ